MKLPLKGKEDELKSVLGAKGYHDGTIGVKGNCGDLHFKRRNAFNMTYSTMMDDLIDLFEFNKPLLEHAFNQADGHLEDFKIELIHLICYGLEMHLACVIPEPDSISEFLGYEAHLHWLLSD